MASFMSAVLKTLMARQAPGKESKPLPTARGRPVEPSSAANVAEDGSMHRRPARAAGAPDFAGQRAAIADGLARLCTVPEYNRRLATGRDRYEAELLRADVDTPVWNLGGPSPVRLELLVRPDADGNERLHIVCEMTHHNPGGHVETSNVDMPVDGMSASAVRDALECAVTKLLDPEIEKAKARREQVWGGYESLRNNLPETQFAAQNIADCWAQAARGEDDLMRRVFQGVSHEFWANHEGGVWHTFKGRSAGGIEATIDLVGPDGAGRFALRGEVSGVSGDLNDRCEFGGLGKSAIRYNVEDLPRAFEDFKEVISQHYEVSRSIGNSYR